MKNRRNVIVAFLLIATMLLGVGYATLTEELTLTGSAIVDHAAAEDTFEAAVYFTEPSPSDNTLADYITVSGDGDTATFNVTSLDAVNESTTLTVKIKNDNAFPVYVTVGTPTETESSDCFTFEVEQSALVIPAGETITVTIEVTMKALPQTFTDNKYTASYTLIYTVKDTNTNP